MLISKVPLVGMLLPLFSHRTRCPPRDEHPMFLLRPWPGKKMPAVLNYYKKTMKEGEAVVEFDNFKHTLSTYDKPLVEVRDSL